VNRNLLKGVVRYRGLSGLVVSLKDVSGPHNLVFCILAALDFVYCTSRSVSANKS
jgi:hypothetical protein